MSLEYEGIKAKTVDFYKRVGVVCERIPYGKVASYGQIALLCGKPKNSRQVGYALNRGLAGKGLPAHRVVNSRGFLSGARSFETPDTQQELLEAECVYSDLENQIDMKIYGWHNTLEEALELLEIFAQRGI